MCPPDQNGTTPGFMEILVMSCQESSVNVTREPTPRQYGTYKVDFELAKVSESYDNDI